MSDDPANAVGQGSIRTGSGAGARKVVVVDHLLFEDEARSDVSVELVVLGGLANGRELYGEYVCMWW